ncbi:hypothetical protein Scep_023742 [Stephania cephalantha]|uniref:Uncharacterized protein n=1 Tax=Stephania cephalantha TaxID=152367 RepID=A0AAP0EY63_9MAGN
MLRSLAESNIMPLRRLLRQGDYAVTEENVWRDDGRVHKTRKKRVARCTNHIERHKDRSRPASSARAESADSRHQCDSKQAAAADQQRDVGGGRRGGLRTMIPGIGARRGARGQQLRRDQQQRRGSGDGAVNGVEQRHGDALSGRSILDERRDFDEARRRNGFKWILKAMVFTSGQAQQSQEQIHAIAMSGPTTTHRNLIEGISWVETHSIRETNGQSEKLIYILADILRI